MNPKHQRLVFIAVSVVMLCAGVLLVLNAFRENLVFFLTPSDIHSNSMLSVEQRVRMGGLVKKDSIVYGHDGSVFFDLTDETESIKVVYKGMLPSLFREGQGAVVEGHITAEAGQPLLFKADRVLTKHDENYMPKDVVDALKKSGRWQETGAKTP